MNQIGSFAGRPNVSFIIAGVKVLCMIDTGSVATLIREDAYNTILRATKRPNNLKKSGELVSVTGQSLHTLGKTNMLIKNTPFSIPMIVVKEMPHEMILGYCELQEGNAHLDTPSNRLFWHGKVWPITNKKSFDTHSSLGAVIPQTSNKQIHDLLLTNQDVFSKDDAENGTCKLPPLHIQTEGPPISQRAYRTPLAKRVVVEREVQRMLRHDIIQPSTSPWSSPITLVTKKDGTNRFCVDLRRVNDVTVDDKYPLPTTSEIFDQLHGSTIFSTLDMRSGYWQFRLDKSSMKKMAFTCHVGLFEFKVLPFGAKTAPALFQRQMNNVLTGYLGRFCMCYLDDLIVYSKSQKDHMRHLSLIFERFRKFELKLKPEKCAFGLPKINLLGHVVSQEGITPNPERINTIKNLKPPRNLREVRSFLGLAGYYRFVVPNFAKISRSLNDLTKKNVAFNWTKERDIAFQKLKDMLVSHHVMALPNTTQPYLVYTDASKTGTGAVLCQVDNNGVERVIHYHSQSLTPAQQRYSSLEQEMLAIVHALKKFHPYIYGAKTTFITDCSGLLGLLNKGVQSIRVQRWGMLFRESGADLRHTKGKTNTRADMLSRINYKDSVTVINTAHFHNSNSSFMTENEKTFSLKQAATMLSLMDHFPEQISVIDADNDWVDPNAFTDQNTSNKLPLTYDNLNVNDIQREQEIEFPDLLQEARDNEDSYYTVINNLLYSNKLPFDEKIPDYPRIVLPSRFHNQVIDRCHKTVGHMSSQKTLLQVTEAYVWPRMRSTIRKRLAICQVCLVHAQRQVHVPFEEMPIPNYCFQLCSADLVGPLPMSNPNNNKYILCIIDHLSGYCECYPLPDKTNQSVWNAFEHQFVPRHGYPESLITDNGKEFVANEWRRYLHDTGVNHVRITPQNPKANGRVERFNRTIKHMLAKLINNRQSDWETKLAAALTAHRSTVSDVTGYTPHFLVYARHPRLPLTRCLQVNNPNQPFGNRLHNLAQALREARTNTVASRRYNRQRLNKKSNTGRIVTGDSVVLKAQEPITFTSKWDPHWVVTRVIGPVLFLHNQITNQTKTVNRDKVILVDPNIVWDEIPPRPRRQQQRPAQPPRQQPQQLDRDNIVVHQPAGAQLNIQAPLPPTIPPSPPPVPHQRPPNGAVQNDIYVPHQQIAHQQPPVPISQNRLPIPTSQDIRILQQQVSPDQLSQDIIILQQPPQQAPSAAGPRRRRGRYPLAKPKIQQVPHSQQPMEVTQARAREFRKREHPRQLDASYSPPRRRSARIILQNRPIAQAIRGINAQDSTSSAQTNAQH